MANLNYIVGDATDPVDTGGNRVIVHVCNSIGAWGSGFVVPLAKRYPNAERQYRRMDARPLGTVGWANALGTTFNGVPGDRTDLFVANLIGQDSVAGQTADGEVPIRYDAINVGLRTVARTILDRYPATVHMPRMGCGLAGGDWRVIEALIKSNLTDNGIDVYVYDLPGQPFEGNQ